MDADKSWGNMNERYELSEVPDWLTDMDKEILEVLTTDLILTPSVIAENIGRSRKGVSNRLNALQAGGVVEKIDRGKYRISDKGMGIWSNIEGHKFRNRRHEVTKRRLIRKEFGVSQEEYFDTVHREIQKLSTNEREDDEKVEEAIERAEERLRESKS